ncbi:aromatic amino acid lyase [Hymenobacter sp. BT559]|uniref:aromatic amino acid lyase n=1 Tax=Hymenobacter sp. BT559 TaxID=2795729 RepID=UPI0018EC29EF|nr:aromatic amino acid lyase [Hymenobacter sp. BT559]MBJ6141935.1 aromatic amino acid lyase [Hymenobacter sp. BT559]
MPYLHPNEPLTLAALAALLRSTEAVRLQPEAEQSHASSPLPAVETAPENPAQWLASLLTALAAGTGPELPAALVRRMLLLAAHRLGRADAAAGPVVRRLLDFYSREVWPVVYEQGSLGAGHDQVPLAHLGLPLLGLGEVNYQGYRLAAADVLGLFGWEPPQLAPALALRLLSGSDFTLAYATEVLERTERLLRAAAVVGSLAAAPASIDLLGDARQAIEAACNADAPAPTSFTELLTPSTPASALDHALAQLTQVAAQVGAQAAQRTATLVAQPRHLAPEPEAQFGLLALPRVAASLVQQCGTWADAGDAARSPHGAAAAQEARRVVELAEQLVGLELLAAAQALDLRGPAAPDLGPAPSPALAQAVAAFREHVTFAAHDRVLAPDLHRAARFVREYAWAQE